MKTLLISYYWFPWNNSGVFRWTNFSKHIDFDVLTCRRPLRSFRDYSMSATMKPSSLYGNVRKFGACLPAIVWGFIAPFVAMFKRYDTYIFTSPPESMLIGAYLLQLFGKNVVVDMRDAISREKQYFKFMIPVYSFFYNRIDNVIVAYWFISPGKKVVYSGYEDVAKVKYKGCYSERVSRGWYLYKLSLGYMPDQSRKPIGYGSGSAQTFRHLEFPLGDNFHPEVYAHNLISVKESALRLRDYLLLER